MVVLRIKFPLTSLKGNSHQILLSEMSLPGVEVLIEKLLPKIYGRLGKENHSNARFTLADPTPRCCRLSQCEWVPDPESAGRSGAGRVQRN